MKLSIIVPVYNEGEDVLRFNLESLINQTFTDKEIICVDDVTGEKDKKVLNEYKEKGLIKVIENEIHLGPGTCWNRGFMEAKGEYISFLYAKDFVGKCFYEKLVSKAEEEKADVVASDYTKVLFRKFEGGEKEKLHYKEQVGSLDEEKRADLIIKPGYLGTKIIKRNLLWDNGIWAPDLITMADMCINPLVLMCATKFAYLEENDFYYYLNSVTEPDAVTAMCDDRVTAMTYFLEECVKREFFADYLDEIEYRYTEDMYIINLFTYMAKVPENKRDVEFLEMLKDGIVETFPDFDENPYYEIYDEEDIRELALLNADNPKRFNKLFSKILKHGK